VTWLSPVSDALAHDGRNCLACGGALRWVEAGGDDLELPPAPQGDVDTENVELVFSIYRALSVNDRAAFLAPLDAEVEWRPLTIEVAGDRPYRGRDDVARWLDFVGKAWSSCRWDWIDVRSRGDAVAVVATLTTEPREREGFQHMAAHLWRLNDQSVVSMRASTDAEQVLKELERS
jgi:ketosteroid isomerase-like protein